MIRRLLIAALFLSATGVRATAAERVDVPGVAHRVDDVIERGCRTDGVTALEACSALEFQRRVWLDLAGRVPPLADVSKIANGGLLDREALVDRLLASPEFARYWGMMWTQYLTDQRPFGTPEYDGRRLLQFLVESFRENRPYHQVISQLIEGEGTSDVSGPVNFLLRHQAEPVPLAGAVSQKLLGLSLQCAECHDHPHARWKQKDFWGLAAHFARLRKMTPTAPENGEAFFVIIERPRGELTVADKRATPNEAGEFPRKTVFPQLIDQPRSDPGRQRRTVLVEWLTNPANAYPSRHVVSLVWDKLMGAKLVPNLDQWPPAEASTNSELLNGLADDFVRHDWNVQRLIRIVVLSKAYQRSSRSTQGEPPATGREPQELQLAGWGRARIRPLSADQLHLSIGQAFGYHHDETDYRLAESTGEEFTRDIPVENLGPTSATMGRSLALYNSDYVRGAVDLGLEAAIRLYGPAAGAEHIDRFFLCLLSRRPTNEERESFQDLAGTGDPREGLQDAIWVLLNSTEFVTNH